MKYFTDYPLPPLYNNTIKEIQVLSYDGNKYCVIKFANQKMEIKSGYIIDKYKNQITKEKLSSLPQTKSLDHVLCI
jgi:hypothetical protein